MICKQCANSKILEEGIVWCMKNEEIVVDEPNQKTCGFKLKISLCV
jgi:hypothetical protein